MLVLGIGEMKALTLRRRAAEIGEKTKTSSFATKTVVVAIFGSKGFSPISAPLR